MFFGNMEMRGFAQRSHERSIMGEKSRPFTGWNGPPRVTKNEVRGAKRASWGRRGAAWGGVGRRGAARVGGVPCGARRLRRRGARRSARGSAGCVRARSACVQGALTVVAARGLRAWQHKAWMHGLNQETGMGSILSRAMKNVKI